LGQADQCAVKVTLMIEWGERAMAHALVPEDVGRADGASDCVTEVTVALVAERFLAGSATEKFEAEAPSFQVMNDHDDP